MVRCKKCAQPVGVVSPLYMTTGDLRYVTIRCIRNCVSASTVGGIMYPLASGDWYKVSEIDVVNWISEGMTFEFEDINDAIYIQDKYNL